VEGSKGVSSVFCKFFKATIFASVFIILTGCNYNSQSVANAVAKEPTRRSAWIAYWDVDAGEKDLEKIGRKKLDKLSYFAAYFDKYDRIFIPPELSEKKNKLKTVKRKHETYLTFVNDKQNFDESIVMKDVEVLRRLFSDDATIERHIDEIIALTLQGGYDGIEIDYERIWKDEKVGQSFLRFINKLYGKVQEQNLKLRVVLEPSTPFSSTNFSKGPEYVVMLYNLYGLHSAPGPKANKEFIQKTVTRMESLPGAKSVAFSTGGCLWGDNGKKRFLTEGEAKALAMTFSSETKRDKDSQCVVFEYKDKGVSYQVWYADVETLNYWISIAKEQGENNISLWRLGGNANIDKIQ
jgi:spore germination protein YaaH